MKKTSRPVAWKLTRIVKPFEAEVLLEVFKQAGMPAPHYLETSAGENVRLEMVYTQKPPRLAGWKCVPLADFDLAANNALEKPLRIGRTWMVMPSGTEGKKEKQRHRLVVEAGMGFGSGKHETTRLCLEMLEDAPVGKSCLDLGAGSGILAIAAEKIGFKQVVAVELDPKAVSNAKRNARLNGIRRIEWIRADLGRWKNERAYDLVMANLLAGLLVEQAGRVAGWVRRGGRLICSGILRRQANDVCHAFSSRGMRFEEKKVRGKWCALRFSRAVTYSGNSILVEKAVREPRPPFVAK
ncbi:MAG: 50S ribosomal protein L11 methyltransferase [Verrucomicrobiae bacterium]|nr:50S ribosomal protein L11 methyltransferase [Verrucomicrobiae bacterium]